MQSIKSLHCRYITSALQRTDMKAVGLQLALDLMHEKEHRDLITGRTGVRLCLNYLSQFSDSSHFS